TDEQLYSQAMKQFTAVNVPRHEEDIKEETVEVPPIEVDFDALRQENEHVIGWIYCEGTVINYPVVQGSDNQYYLKHAYDGTYTTSGSIFIDC
ncbi:class B sortase, partial [Vibrio parahaemolyticus]